MEATEGADAEALARDMIEVHGAEAATVARTNARAAALVGRAGEAKSWIRVLTAIQRQLAGKALSSGAAGDAPTILPSLARS